MLGTIQLSSKGCSKGFCFLFHIPVGLLFSLWISIDKNLSGQFQKLASIHSSESLPFLQFLPYVSLHLANKSGANHLPVFSGFQVEGGVQMEGLAQMLIKLAGTLIWSLENH
jgi:hypothetical protein